MISKEEVFIGKTVIIKTKRNGVYLGTVIEKDEEGFFSKAINEEVIFIPYSGLI